MGFEGFWFFQISFFRKIDLTGGADDRRKGMAVGRAVGRAPIHGCILLAMVLLFSDAIFVSPPFHSRSARRRTPRVAFAFATTGRTGFT